MSSSDLSPQNLASCAEGGSGGNLVGATKNGDTKERGMDSNVGYAVAAPTGPAQVRV